MLLSRRHGAEVYLAGSTSRARAFLEGRAFFEGDEARLKLRQMLVLIAALVLVVSLVLVSSEVLPGWWLLINAALVLAAVMFERRASTRQGS